MRVLETAIGNGLPHEVPETLRYALENNAFVFSGFKTFHALREVGLSMLTEKGDIKPFNDFLTDVKKINAQYNHNYLYAEYNHAVGAAQMAAKWHDFEQDGDRYYLQYRTAGDDKVREEHAALNGTTLPPSDPFWELFCRRTAGTAAVRRYRCAKTDTRRPTQNWPCNAEMNAPREQNGRFSDIMRANRCIIPPEAPLLQGQQGGKAGHRTGDAGSYQGETHRNIAGAVA